MEVVVGLVLAVVVIGALAFAVVLYNRLVRLRNQAEEGWAGIDVQLQRRADLVPNLVETVKGYAAHEEGVLTDVTRARAALQQASGPAANAAASDLLTNALGRLFAVAEDYPDLKASANFGQLQRQLSDIEQELSLARRWYNASVEDLNTATQTFPSVLVASTFGFERREYFEATDDAQATPIVDFDRG